MLLEKANLKDKNGRDNEKRAKDRDSSDKPLVCMIYFFASQMSRHLETVNISKDGKIVPSNDQHAQTVQMHRFDNLLSEIQHQAHLSPFVTRFQTYPVEMSPPGRPRGTSKESMHDTVVQVNFRNKRAWEQWIQTKAWQNFMEKTEKEAVFRRVPHVRCAGSLKGLRDPVEVLMS